MTDKEKAKLNQVFEYFSQDSNVIPIGSRVWGGSTDNSDYDFCMDDVVFKKLIPRLEELGIVIDNLFGMYGESVKDAPMRNIGNYKFYLYKIQDSTYTHERVQVNIITYSPAQLIMIEDINQAMAELVGTELHKRICNNKAIRVKVFECFREIMFSTEAPVDTDLDFPF